jgi:hypothetical protein
MTSKEMVALVVLRQAYQMSTFSIGKSVDLLRDEKK